MGDDESLPIASRDVHYVGDGELKFPANIAPQYNVNYSETTAHMIAELYSSGYTLTDIGRMSGFPVYQTIMNWVKKHPEFKTKLDNCRAARAMHFENEAVEIAKEPLDHRDVPGARLRFDIYAKAAEWNDPTRYGKRTTHAGDASNPITFNFITGVPAPLPHQEPPKLGPDGRVMKPDIEVKADLITEERNESG